MPLKFHCFQLILHEAVMIRSPVEDEFSASVLDYLKVMGPILGDDWSHSHHQLRFSVVFHSFEVNPRRSVHSPRYHLIIALIISERRD
jgi:hypothetical protein